VAMDMLLCEEGKGRERERRVRATV
jgi:hypothetical protein